MHHSLKDSMKFAGMPVKIGWQDEQYRCPPLPLGWDEVDRALPDQGLPRGAVVEFSVSGAAAHATSLSLAACRAAQRQSERAGEMAWCAFIDPSGSLYGPGVALAGVELERLLVVQPAIEMLEKVALRVVESRSFSVVVIDTTCGLAHLGLGSLGNWPRVVRRLSLALEQSHACVILITDKQARRPLPLPTALRVELGNVGPDRLSFQVAKERYGRVSPARVISLADRDRESLPMRVASIHATSRNGNVAPVAPPSAPALSVIRTA